MTERIDLHDQAMRVLDDLEANLRTACDDLRSLLANVVPKEDGLVNVRIPRQMVLGDWVRLPESPRWWQILSCAYDFHRGTYVLRFRNNNASIYLNAGKSLPYLTDAEMQAHYDREEAA